MQVCPECWVQLAEQDNLQLLPLPMDSVSCTRDCRSGILYSGLLPRSQEGFFPTGTSISTSWRLLLYLHLLYRIQVLSTHKTFISASASAGLSFLAWSWPHACHSLNADALQAVELALTPPAAAQHHCHIKNMFTSLSLRCMLPDVCKLVTEVHAS